MEADTSENTEMSTTVKHVSNAPGAVPKRPRTLASLTTATRLETKAVKVKKKNQPMNAISVIEPAKSAELGLQILKTMRKMREAMYLVYSFPTVYL